MDIEYNQTNDCQQEDFQIIDSNNNQNSQQNYFDHVVGLLQEIVISPEFQKKIHLFMKQNWYQEENNTLQQQKIFQKFSETFTTYLSQKLSLSLPNFKMPSFFQLLSDRRNQIDQQILDTLQSLSDVSAFNQFIKDYKTSYDEQQTYKVLTIKSNKIPQNKTVKGKDNIFGNSANNNPLFDVKMKKPKKEKTSNLIDKNQDQLLVPDLVLTIKGIRKD